MSEFLCLFYNLLQLSSFYRHSEHVAELYFIQSSGNMMDYPAWRKKPPMPQYIAFKKSYRLDPTATDDNDTIRPVSSLVLSKNSARMELYDI